MAGAFPQDFIQSVRGAGDIVRLVSDHVPLKPSGSRLKGLCPFHEEKTPSFSVDPSQQLFYCFGCQTGGDIFKFVMLYEKVGFPEAVESLARRWGIPLPDKGRAKAAGPLERLQQINRAAAAFFEARLADAEGGSRCREYLNARGVDGGVTARLGLGYAPEGWEALRGHLVTKQFSPDEIVLAGLAVPRKAGGGEYDRFRGRLIFPIRDLDGRTIAFGGRTLADEEPKYINSPETPAYKKGEHLYGLDLAREAIRREGFAIVVEGYLDLAALVQAGFENVVASLGTAFTPVQARLLARYSNRAVFSYDGDSAGASATARSLDLLLAKGFDVRVVQLPGDEDPDDFVRHHGAEAYGALLREAPGYLDFLIRRQARERDLRRIDEKVSAVNAVLPHIARLSNSIERASWAARLSDALRLDDELVLQELRTAVREARSRIRQRPGASRPPREAELRLVVQLLRSAEERARARAELCLDDLEGAAVEPIVRAILQLHDEARPVDYPTVRDRLEDEGQQDLLTRIAFRDEPAEGAGVGDCLEAFRRQKLARELKRGCRDMQRDSGAVMPDDEVVRQLVHLQELARRRDALS